MKFMMTILSVLFLTLPFMEAGEFVYNETAGRVQGTASTPTHDFPVNVLRFLVTIDSVNVDNKRVVKVTIPVEGITTNHEQRDKHMFEGVLLKEKYPAIYFEATTDVITPREGSFTLEGTLTIQGIKKPYDIQGRIRKVGDHWVATADFTVLMSDFSLSRPGFGPLKVRDEIKMSLYLKANPGNY